TSPKQTLCTPNLPNHPFESITVHFWYVRSAGFLLRTQYPRIAPGGQTTNIGIPHDLAYSTTSAVPPSPREGWPSQTAIKMSLCRTTSRPATMYASSEGWAKER